MTPQLQQLLDSLATRNVQKIRLIEGQTAQIWRDNAWKEGSLQVTSELLNALELSDGARELQTSNARFRAETETVGEARQITLTNLGATTAQLKATPAAATPPPIPRTPSMVGDKISGDKVGGAKTASDKTGDFKIADGGNIRNVGARVGDLKNVPLPVAAVPAEPVAPVAPAKQQWFYVADGEQIGPKARITMQSLIMGGTITRETLVWREGLPAWLPAWLPASESEFAASLPATTPTQAAPPASPPGESADFKNVDMDFTRELDRTNTLQGFGGIAFGLIIIVLGIGVPATLAKVRGNNRKMNRSIPFEKLVAGKNAEAEDLQLKRLVSSYSSNSESSDASNPDSDDDVYGGYFLYNSGERGEAVLRVTDWDWLGRPQTWKILTQPSDFSAELARRVDVATKFDVEVSLERANRTQYPGKVDYYETDSWIEDGKRMQKRFKYKTTYIKVTVTKFDATGYPDQIFIGE